MPPTEAELAKAAKYDTMLEDGAKVYEVFIRAKGPNQWFPVGPMAVKQDWMIVPEMWKAEADMKKAGFKMYPALLNAPCFGKVEYGYRVRDDEKKVTEEEIREAGGKLNPFEDVVLLERAADGSDGAPAELGWKEKLDKWMNPYGSGK
jgi:predicted membrane-bound spermidine synthase